MRRTALIAALVIVAVVFAFALWVGLGHEASAGTKRIEPVVLASAPLDSAENAPARIDPVVVESSSRAPIVARKAAPRPRKKTERFVSGGSRLRVKVVEAFSNEPITCGVVAWSSERETEFPDHDQVPVADAVRGVSVLGGEPGYGDLSFEGECTPFEDAHVRILLLPGRNELTLTVRRALTGTITLLREAGDVTEISCPQVIQMRGDAVADEFCVRPGPPMQYVFKVPYPGQYCVRWLRAPDGYVLPKEQLVEVGNGARADVAIELARRP